MSDKELKKEQNGKRVLTTEEKVKENMKKRKKRLIRKRIISWAVFLIIIGVGFFTYSFYKSEGRMWWSTPVDTSLSATMNETTISQISISETIDLSGDVEPYDIQEVVFRSTGAVTGVFVEEGETVTRGQLLATIDDTSQQYEVANIENLIASAKLDGSTKQIELYEMQLEQRKNLLDYTRSYANFDGIVASVSVDEGDYAEAGSTVMVIVDTSKLKATVEIDEIDMQSVELGMVATLSFDAVPSQDIEAYVSYIPLLGRSTTQGIGVKDVELIIEDFPEGISPGYTFAGVITEEEEQTALIVQSTAITTNDDDTTTLTIKGDDGKFTKVQVKTKYLGEGMSEILSGDVAEGDIAIIPSAEVESGFQLGFGSGPGAGTGGGDRRPPDAQ